MTNEELLEAITAQLNEFRQEVNERLDTIEEDVEITRDGVNALLDWADIAGRTINVRLAE